MLVIFISRFIVVVFCYLFSIFVFLYVFWILRVSKMDDIGYTLSGEIFMAWVIYVGTGHGRYGKGSLGRGIRCFFLLFQFCFLSRLGE